MEFLDLYDKTGKSLNKKIVRGTLNLAKNEFIKLVTVWIKCQGKYLIQKTSKQKGDEYAVSGGHVQAGKTSLEQACLELQEELNLNLITNQLKLLGNILWQNLIFDVYLYEDDNLMQTNFDLQLSEVADVVWLSVDEIKVLATLGKVRKSTVLQLEQLICR